MEGLAAVVLPFGRCGADDVALIGGKAAGLGTLRRAGLPVPQGFAVTTAAFAEHLVRGDLRERIASELAAIDGAAPDAVDAAAARVRALIEDAPMPEAVDAAIRAAYVRLCDEAGGAPVPVAVRSSTTAEDSADASFAGQQDTYLWVIAAAAVIAHVKRCWASLYTARSISYRRDQHIGERGLLMGVAVQRMVLARAAGVAMTLNPANGDRSKVAIEASFGLGEAVVGGTVTPDRFLVDKVMLDIVETKLAHKEVELVPDVDGWGVAQRDVEPWRQGLPSLEPDQVKAVAALAKRAEQHYGSPQDVEWALDAAVDPPAVVLLQSRPETVWSRKPAPIADRSAYETGLGSIVNTLVNPLAGRGPQVSTTTMSKRFVSPYEDPAPDGAEGWQELYPYYLRFREDRRELEDAKFWFADLSHWPNVFKPFETTLVEFAIKCLGQYNTRHYLVPPANGIDYRVHNGYVYMSPVAVTEEEIPERVPHFLERAGYYFSNWPSLLDHWQEKIRRVIAELQAIEFEPLPDRVPTEWVTEGRGLDNTFDLIRSYDRAIELCYEAWQYHFEFLNLGYVAYLDFFGFCKEAFPGVSEQGIAQMVQGIDVDLFRPDDELKKLARLAVELEVDSPLAAGGAPDTVLSQIGQLPRGDGWLDAWETAKYPWFNFTSGSGFYASDGVWFDRLEIPLGYLRDYVARVRAGETIERPIEATAAERERITAEYRAALPDDQARAAFDKKLVLARLVFPYVENHNFYIEHWAMSVFWRKIRQLGRVLAGAGFWDEAEDIFYLRRDEIGAVLFDYGNGWATGAGAIGPWHWPSEIERRKRIVAALASRPPRPAMNEPPEVVTEPFTIMLYGITTESVNKWLSGSEATDTLTGMAASAGRAEGVARVVHDAAELDEVREGEILVARVTAPGWGPVFARIAATVTDIGGMMSHAAIVCREYGLPAVTGTGSATAVIRTGDMVLVDGSAGTVTLLDGTPEG